MTLLQAFDADNYQFQLRVGKDRSIHSYHIMLRARNYVADFIKAWEHQSDIPLSRLQLDFIQRFSVYLSIDRGLRGATIWLNCMMLKGVILRAHRRGLINRNPFAEFHIAKNIREREYLSEDEIRLIMNHPFINPMQAYVRDLFVFSALTGMSYIDIRQLKLTDIFLLDGYRWIISSRHKTGIPFQVRLLPQAYGIIRRYAKNDKQQIFDWCEYHAIAKRLSSVLNECGIHRHITFHCARHSFAVMALNQGIPIESLSRILGHSNIKTTQIYARITMKKLGSDFKHFENNLNPIFSEKKESLHSRIKNKILSFLRKR